MSRQPTLDTYFKTKHKKNSSSKSMTDLKKNTGKTNRNKKINLSLIKSPTPTKSSMVKKLEKQVIDLSSEDDDFCSPLPMNGGDFVLSKKEIVSDSSQDTIPYSLTPEKTTPVLSTPLKTPQSCSSPKSSPSSRTKFYSPIKKRIVTKRTPVKRKLGAEFLEKKPPVNDDYPKDDKTKALIYIITKCLETESLKRLLSEDSQLLLNNCLLVLKPGMRVICRLYWRKAGWYKADQMKAILKEDSQLDDPNFHAMLDSLITNGLLVRGSVDHSGGNLSFDDLAAILKADELKHICKDLKLKIQSKQDAIGALRSYCRMSSIGNYFTGSSQSNTNRVLRIMMQQAGPCFKLSDSARTTLEKLYVLMYLGINYEIIREKRLEVTILYDIVRTETYPIDKNMELDDASVVFENKEQFDRYFSAHRIYEDFLERTDLNEKCNIVNKVYTMYKEMSEGELLCYKALPLWLRRYTPAHIYVKILEDGVVELKKKKTREHNIQAVDILTSLINQVGFRQHKKADWYSEKALIFYNLEQFDEAAKVLLEGLNSSLPADAKDGLRPRIRKISKPACDWLRGQLLEHADRDNTMEKTLPANHIYKQPMDRTTKRGKIKFETRLESERVVQDAEQYCISHYIQTGEFTHGGHWEGSIVSTMFFLLLWDAIYGATRARGIFLTHYQKYPLDMFCDSFYTNRQEELEERLAILELCTTEEMLDIMSHQWNTRDPCELSGINRSIGWASLSAISRCLGPQSAAAICRRLALDYRYTHSGFPDLTLWNVHTGKIKFVEVKTDSDKPSMKQIQWMHYLRQHGILTEFCYVGARTTRCKARPS